ncbi:polysaccharide lyase 8 family protein [Corynebacterium pygosceleis]|uniref:polysaccharide lyase 8 family protein n=1 Tax=Corynebacterium pygosceleis TaxID=2800406 RepID=UPI001906237B|nr:polysaccharide lyase 8 family protein [Corynebacterium pygosceleis]MCK7675590.1 polysaccharide lyase 8 family protein [Corynebacterium pygosceleis]MCL0121016.1 polysaccharide lyase 8 family protein [Corynebacterium pygosceleis]
MNLNRRTFLKASATAGVIAALGSVFREAAAAEIPAPLFRELRERWIDIITSRHLFDPSDAAFTPLLASLDRSVDRALDDLATGPEAETTVFRSKNLADEKAPDITSTARSILTLANGWSIPGSRHHKSPEVLEAAVTALDRFLDLRYNPGQFEYGNWWDWESGAARAVGDVMCLLGDEIPADTMAKAAAGIAHFIPDPTEQEINKGASRKTSTGANRLDLCRAVACAAIAAEDETRLRDALNGLSDTWRYVETGDGFYRDGSFVQHTHIPYTGAYGNVLISGLSLMFDLVAGTTFDISEEGKQRVYYLVDQAYIPIIVEGQAIDGVRGRSISRKIEPGSSHGISILTSIIRLAERAPAEYAERWRGLCSGWLHRNTYNDFTDTGSMSQLALVNRAMSFPAAPALSEPKMFTSMDRLVHRSADWTVAVSMCSKRISWYEYGNRENELGSRTGSGMRYLMLPENMGQYEDGFWCTVDYSAPTGTTVDHRELERGVGDSWGVDTPQNEWTGGLTSGPLSLAGMHLIGPDLNGLEARRLWFGTPDSVVELVGGVTAPDSPAMTVVEHRNMGENGDPVLTVDGNRVTGESTVTNPTWAHLDGVAGYVFLTPGTVRASVTERTNTWLNVNPFRTGYPGADEPVTRTWATIQFDHVGESENAGGWILLPRASAGETRRIAEALSGPAAAAKIERNDRSAQVVQVGSTTGFAVWEPGTYANWEFGQPSIVLAEYGTDTVTVTAADPTQEAANVTITVPGEWPVSTGEGVSVTATPTATTLVVDTAGREGASRTVVLRRRGTTPPPSGESSTGGLSFGSVTGGSSFFSS